MRGIGAAAAAARRHANLPSYASAFSSFSGIGGRGGAGRGSGRGLPPSASAPPRAPGRPFVEEDDGAEDLFAAASSAGRGRGEPAIPPSPTTPPFSAAGRGRGSPLPPPPSVEDPTLKQPTLTKRLGFVPPPSDPEPPPTAVASSSSSEPPRSVPTSGAGRGVPRAQQAADKAPEENRFVRRREAKKAPTTPSTPSGQPKLDPKEAVKRALELLGRGGGDGGGGGRGRGGRAGRGRGREGGRRPAAVEEQELPFDLGDPADAEKFEKYLGPEKLAIWDMAFDEAFEEAVPGVEEDEWIDAVHQNNCIEFEPEYNASFENPDIEEKPPMSLEEVLQKVKPFIVTYEGIKDEDEWQEAVKDVMKRAPHMKELIDMYSGPDVVTAKQQEEELQRVANTLPESIPNSVKRFTDKTLLSLKNNPGWGFQKKCQFMDKFVREVSEQYK